MRSPSHHARQFAAEVDSAFKAVAGWYSYLDTIEIIVASREAGSVLRLLVESKAKFSRWSNRNAATPVTIRIQQPKRDILAWLDREAPSLQLVRADLALDFHLRASADGEAEALALQAFLAAHITQPWHGKRRMGFSGRGAYLAGPWQGRNIAIYSDRPSKVSGLPCTHVEMRFFSARQVRKLGAVKLVSLFDLRPMEILRRQARLSKLEAVSIRQKVEAVITTSMLKWKEIGIEMDGRAAVAKKVRGLMARALACGEDGEVPANLFDAPAQVWLESLRHLVGRSIAHAPFPALPCLSCQEVIQPE